MHVPVWTTITGSQPQLHVGILWRPGLHPRDPDGTGKQEFRSSPPACHEEPESRAMGLALDQIQLSVPI